VVKKHGRAADAYVAARQGHYAMDAKELTRYATPDGTLQRVAELVDCYLGGFLGRLITSAKVCHT
jgi:hypothetical protein